MSKVNGVLDMALSEVQKDLSFIEIPPTTVKKLIGGTGRASKLQVQNSLKYYVGEQEYKTDDESDAVACGIAYLIHESIPIRGLNMNKIAAEQSHNRRIAKEQAQQAREHLALARAKHSAKMLEAKRAKAEAKKATEDSGISKETNKNTKTK